MASSSQSSGNNMENFDGMRRFCSHKIPALFRTSDSDKNPGMRYSCCRYRFTANNCGFWEWHDEKLTPHYKSYFLRMKAERDNALRMQGPNNCRVDFTVDEDNELFTRVDEDNESNINGEEGASKNEDLLSFTKAMTLSQKNLEYQIRLIYVAFAFVILMFVIVYKG